MIDAAGVWTCDRSGDCCRQPFAVSMTAAERRAVETRPAQRALAWTLAANGMHVLQARPCPFFRDGEGCTVYDVRPYQCRRYMCGRHDVASQPFTTQPIPSRVLFSRSLRTQYQAQQAEAQTWARDHGWAPSGVP